MRRSAILGSSPFLQRRSSRGHKDARLAAGQDVKPDMWFDNVERVTAANVGHVPGQEPVRYVRNIYNYYIAYKLLEEHRHATETIKRTGTIHPWRRSRLRPQGCFPPRRDAL